MIKDFLFLDYSWVPNSRLLFNKFAEKGHTIDIVDEHQIMSFIPEHQYKNVVVYLHEHHLLGRINFLINNYFQDCFLIQHDDTDADYLNRFTERMPDLFMQRELRAYTNIETNSPIYPFHFPIPSIYNEQHQIKDIDVSFMGIYNNHRRKPFVDHIIKLSNNELKHLNWHIDFGDTRTPGKFRMVTNRSKISLHYWGNSYDSIRIWEVLSAKSALIMPKLENLSVSDEHMPLTEYCIMRDDFQDVGDKIQYLLEENRWSELAKNGYDAYELRHNPDCVFEQYYKNVIKHCKL